jgi:hypothetical protein
MIKYICIFTFILFLSSTCFSQELKNGTYKSDWDGLLKISDLNKQSFRFKFDLSPSSIKGIATFVGKEYKMVQNDCTLIFSSEKNIISVEQEGICGLGLNQTAGGKYKKIK